jgi:hypothetical protein
MKTAAEKFLEKKYHAKVISADLKASKKFVIENMEEFAATDKAIIAKMEELIEHIKTHRPNVLDWHDKRCQLESELHALKDKKDVT